MMVMISGADVDRKLQDSAMLGTSGYYLKTNVLHQILQFSSSLMHKHYTHPFYYNAYFIPYPF